MHQPPAPTPCAACHRTIPAWDAPRVACTGCQHRAAAHLADLPDLYAALDPTPPRSGPGSRGATAGSRPPVDLGVVDLTARHGVLAVLVGWMRVWHEDGAGELPPWPARDAARVAAACRWLRWHLDWACRQHEAAAEALREIRDAHHQVHHAATGERRERPVWVLCPCGTAIPWRVSHDAYRCGGCAARYGREEAAALPQAPRTRAAA